MDHTVNAGVDKKFFTHGPRMRLQNICPKVNKMSFNLRIYLFFISIFKCKEKQIVLLSSLDVGFAIGGDSGIDYLVLQVHYASVDKFQSKNIIQ